jgi:acetyl-CoA acetyltransferase
VFLLLQKGFAMGDAFVLGGVRTPFGRYGGALSHVRTDDLLGQTMVWACEGVGVDLDRIEDIAAGCVNGAGEAAFSLQARRGSAGARLSARSVPRAGLRREVLSAMCGR